MYSSRHCHRLFLLWEVGCFFGNHNLGARHQFRFAARLRHAKAHEPGTYRPARRKVHRGRRISGAAQSTTSPTNADSVSAIRHFRGRSGATLDSPAIRTPLIEANTTTCCAMYRITSMIGHVRAHSYALNHCSLLTSCTMCDRTTAIDHTFRPIED